MVITQSGSNLFSVSYLLSSDFHKLQENGNAVSKLLQSWEIIIITIIIIIT